MIRGAAGIVDTSDMSRTLEDAKIKQLKEDCDDDDDDDDDDDSNCTVIGALTQT